EFYYHCGRSPSRSQPYKSELFSGEYYSTFVRAVAGSITRIFNRLPACPLPCQPPCPYSLLLGRRNIKLEVNDIPILHNIRLPLLPILPRRLDRPHRLLPITQVVEVLIRHHFGLDKAPLE